MRLVTPALACAALAAAFGGGCATTPEEDTVLQAKLADLDARLARLERASQSQVELAQHQEAEQAEVRALRGQLDQLEHDNAALRKQQHDLYADLDARVKALSAGGTASGGGAAAPGSAGTAATGGTAAGAAAAPGGAPGDGEASSTEQAVYSQSFDALKAGSYSIAITGFKDFLKNYPQSPLAENAQYWLGEAYYVNHDYDSAADAFRAVLKKWPDARKAPDALLKLGYTQLEQKQYAAARTTLAGVTQRYPGTDAAKLAADKLRRIPAQ
ncbi:MAG TPA: tol-pal system protein YbgF [Steroidobacteraceae bacterium]|nr:tol-pal system protein YbgF [Steroidobacteraceae bacterium]